MQAVAGKSSRAFARTVYQAVPGAPAKQPKPVYDALQWLEAVLKRPPPRIERMNHTANHTLLPDC